MQSRWRYAAVVILAATLTACGASGKSSTQGSPPPISGLPSGDDPSAFAPLPIKAYMLPLAQNGDMISRAFGIEVNSCLKKLGYQPYYNTDFHAPGRMASDPTSLTVHYGVGDAAAATTHGFHNPTAVAPGPESSSPPNPQTQDPDFQLALNGSYAALAQAGTAAPTGPAPSELNGAAIPRGGCSQAAHDSVGGSFEAETTAVQIYQADSSRAMADPRVQSAFATWSSCMKAKGYAYADPIAAGKDPRWNFANPPTSEEIATATATVACADQIHLHATWYAVEAAYEKQDIEKNIEALTKESDGLTAQVKSATAIITAAGLSTTS